MRKGEGKYEHTDWKCFPRPDMYGRIGLVSSQHTAANRLYSSFSRRGTVVASIHLIAVDCLEVTYYLLLIGKWKKSSWGTRSDLSWPHLPFVVCGVSRSNFTVFIVFKMNPRRFKKVQCRLPARIWVSGVYKPSCSFLPIDCVQIGSIFDVPMFDGCSLPRCVTLGVLGVLFGLS